MCEFITWIPFLMCAIAIWPLIAYASLQFDIVSYASEVLHFKLNFIGSWNLTNPNKLKR